MGLVLTVEAWTLSVFGWAWLTFQDLWLPSLLCSHVYYGFLLLTTLNLMVSSLAPDARQSGVAYFNTVFGHCVFYGCCIADSFTTPTLGGEQFRPPVSGPGACCANCNIARANQVLFFTDSPLYMGQAGVLAGYLLVHLLVAGGQQLDPTHRTVWSGTSWSATLGMLLAARFIIVFDGSTMKLIPDSVFYLLLFSQPLVTLSLVFWLFFVAFIALVGCEGVPKINLLGLRIIRSIGFGITAAFVVTSGIVFVLRGMLTMPLLFALVVLFLGALGGVLEAFLAKTGTSLAAAAPQQAAGTTTSGRGALPSQRPRTYIPVPVQMPGGKKAA
jgi:hypothetical protein